MKKTGRNPFAKLIVVCATCLLAATACQSPLDTLSPPDSYSDAALSRASFVLGGRIDSLIVLNETQFDSEFFIQSQQEASSSLGNFHYVWQADRGIGWELLGTGGSTFGSMLELQYMIKYRRLAVSGQHTVLAVSNECSVINKAFFEDPLTATGPEYALPIGPYNNDFAFCHMVNTWGENYNWVYHYGRMAWVELTLDQDMDVAVGVHTPFFNWGPIWVDIFEYTDPDTFWYGGQPLHVLDVRPPYTCNDFQLFPPYCGHDEMSFVGEMLAEGSFVTLPAGKYLIGISGQKNSNAGVHNGPIHFTIGGVPAPVEF